MKSKRPITSILNSDFRYTCAAETDLKKSFARYRKRQQEEQERDMALDRVIRMPARKG